MLACVWVGVSPISVFCVELWKGELKADEELVVLFPVEKGLEVWEFEVLMFKALLLLLPKLKAAVDFLASEDDVDACPN